MFGIRLTDEQVREIENGQLVYLRGMHHKGETFDGYLVMDDKLIRGLAYTDKDSSEWGRYGKYTMRRMDQELIERVYGACARAMVGKLWADRKTLPMEKEAGRYRI